MKRIKKERVGGWVGGWVDGCACVPVPEISLMAAVSFYLMEGRRRAGEKEIYREGWREIKR